MEDTSTDYRPGLREDFDRLYSDQYPRLVRTLYGVLGDAAAAEDCVQEAFVQAFRAWARFVPDRPAGAWLHRIAINVAISHGRRERLRSVGEILRRIGRPGSGPDPAELVTSSDLVKALAALPPKQSAAFILRFVHGYTNREIATATGVKERMIGLRLRQARDGLSRSLGAEWGTELPTSPRLRVDIECAKGCGPADAR